MRIDLYLKPCVLGLLERLTDSAYCMAPIGVTSNVFVHRLYADLKSKTKETILTLRKHIIGVFKTCKRHAKC